MTTGTIGSVVIASAQSVAKVFVIGAVGYGAVLFPRRNPFLPHKVIGTVARFTFHCLLLPLFYGTLARAVTYDTIGDYWFVLVGGFGVLAISFLVATLLQPILAPHARPRDVQALRVAATFPNVVSLPILIFPSLCEFPVVHQGYYSSYSSQNDSTTTTASNDEMEQACVEQSTALVFCYFLSYSLAFWTIGHKQLMQAAAMSDDESESNLRDPADETSQEIDEIDRRITTESNRDTLTNPIENDCENHNLPTINNREELHDESLSRDHPHPNQPLPPKWTRFRLWLVSFSQRIARASQDIFTSPGFVAMFLGLVTALIPPLQQALFQEGGALRFLGSAVEALGSASSPMSTIVVAASLVPLHQALPRIHQQNDEEEADGNNENETDNKNDNISDNNTAVEQQPTNGDSKEPQRDDTLNVSSSRSPTYKAGLVEPNFGSRTRRASSLAVQSWRQSSWKILRQPYRVRLPKCDASTCGSSCRA